ncbi:hypothetical protein KKJFFJLC_00042 [Vibrio phage vB_VpaS_PGB]|nr:hypothetical protein HHKILHMN_00055 [Vibrio phage vB_VpaS_PGA]WVH05585.1 hypothetical protein KKJFFJLC_00042 [Vibrio phage vB_VpaS_PGB]
MHYYKFNIADWAKDTSHLTLEEEAIYFRLINYYYDNEKPIPLETQSVFRRLRLVPHSETASFVLKEFFQETDDGWIHSRCEKLIDEYQQRAERNRKNGSKGGRKKAEPETKDKPSGLPDGTQKEPTLVNQEPLTTNQEPETNNQLVNDKSAKANLSLEIFKYWCEAMRKNPNSTKLTPKRDKAIKARLKDGYTVDQIKQAIDGCRNDPFSMGKNDRQKPFNDIELICRTGEKLESFMTGLTKRQGNINDIGDDFSPPPGWE